MEQASDALAGERDHKVTLAVEGPAGRTHKL